MTDKKIHCMHCRMETYQSYADALRETMRSTQYNRECQNKRAHVWCEAWPSDTQEVIR